MTVDIREFLEQRLTEDELWAKAASAPASYRADERPVPPAGTHWTWAVGENWTPYRVDPLEEYVGEGAGEYSSSLVTVEQWPWRSGPAGRTSPNKVLATEEVASGVGGHIVRHDPARVLRDVEAKRRILAAYVDDDRVRFGAFESCSDSCPATVLDEVLKLLALPYGQHPDYQSGWAP